MDLSHYAYRRTGRLWVADFTALPAGACAQLPGMLAHTRASGATVQIGTSTVVSGLGTDVAGIGRALDADALGLVIEEARTNSQWNSRSPGPPSAGFGGPGPGATMTYAYVASAPDGAPTVTRAQVPTLAYGRYGNSVVPVVGTSYCVSSWQRTVAGAGRASHWAFATATKHSVPIAAEWTRVAQAFVASTTTGFFSFTDTQDGGAALDNLYDLTQYEVGAFPTEAIITTVATATRSGARLWHPYASMLVDRGRIGLELSLQPKGATTGYAADPYVWRVDASNYATISKTDGKVTIVVAGASYTTAVGFTWAAGDSVDLWIEAGGQSIQSVVKARKNGGAVTTLGTSTSPQASLPVNGALDLLQNGSAASVLSCRVERIATYAQGCRPGWAA